MKKQSIGKRILCLFLPLTLLLIFILFPFYWTFITSVKSNAELFSWGVVTYWPHTFTWEAYEKLFTTSVNFLAAMKNSLIVAVLTTIVDVYKRQAQASGKAFETLYTVILGVIFVQGVPEAIVAAVLSAVICRVLIRTVKQR